MCVCVLNTFFPIFNFIFWLEFCFQIRVKNLYGHFTFNFDIFLQGLA